MAGSAEAAEVTDGFFAALRAGEVDAAYERLSRARQAVLDRGSFAALVDHPAFRDHERVELRPPRERTPGRCSYGTLSVAGNEWAVEVFTVAEPDGSWRVESFAIQPPASPRLGLLLEECGYSEGTRAGYSGPAIERKTPVLTR